MVNVPAENTSILTTFMELGSYLFNISPLLALSDIFVRAGWQLVLAIVIITVLIVLSLYLLYAKRQLSHEIERVNHSHAALKQKAYELLNSNTELQKLATVFIHSHDGIMLTDAKNNIVDVNDAFCRITGFTRGEVIGHNPKFLSSGRQPKEFYEKFWNNVTKFGTWTGEIWNRKSDGELFAELLTVSEIREENNTPKGYVGVFTDITKIKEHQQEIEYLAYYDVLTKLPNRFLLTDRLKQALAQAKRHDKKVAIVFIDLDGFKEVNDLFGHDVGDDLLINIARNMQRHLRKGDTLARLGGDEFVAILIDIHDEASCARSVVRLLDAVKNTQIHPMAVTKVSASAGISIYPDCQAKGIEQLLRQADNSMYHAKRMGKDRHHFFAITEDSAPNEIM